MRLQNKICIITGAAQGIGLATALKFAREGATVIVCDLKPGPVDEAVQQCRALGAQAEGFAVNVTQRDQIDAMVAAQPLEACTPLQNDATAVKGSIVLVQRGACAGSCGRVLSLTQVD